MIKVNKNLVLFSGLPILLGALFLFIIQKFSSLIGHAAYYCQSFFNGTMIPIPYYLSIAPIVLIATILALFFIKIFILTFKVQYLKFGLRGKITSKNNITKLIKNLGLEKRTAIISSNEKFAFCLGIKTPKIYISTGLISYLSLKEIEAVLRHEQYHLQNHDTFITVVASIAHFLFPFFPLLDDLIKRYRVEREIAADKFAVKQLGDSYYLLSALRKLLTFPTIGIIPLTAIADQDTLEPRIYSLVNKHYSRKHFRIKHLFITIFSSFVIGFIAIAPVYAKEIHHKEQDLVMFCSAENDCIQSCMDNKNINKLYSDSKNLLFTPTTKLPIDK